MLARGVRPRRVAEAYKVPLSTVTYHRRILARDLREPRSEERPTGVRRRPLRVPVRWIGKEGRAIATLPDGSSLEVRHRRKDIALALLRQRVEERI